MSDHSDSGEDKVASKQQHEDVSFVNLLKKYPVVFEKSQVPDIRTAKSDALKQIRAEWKSLYGKDLLESKISKKINNMKSRLKNKTDLKQTGNKKITLNDWQRDFFELMNGATNPSFQKVPGAVSISGCSTTESRRINNLSIGEHDTTSSSSTEKTTYRLPFNKRKELASTFSSSETDTIYQPPVSKPKISILDQESEETKDLTLQQLQRVVLLEQLEVLRLKKAQLMRENGVTNQNIAQQDGMFYQIL